VASALNVDGQSANCLAMNLRTSQWRRQSSFTAFSREPGTLLLGLHAGVAAHLHPRLEFGLTLGCVVG
jgi:hypothetical protein